MKPSIGLETRVCDTPIPAGPKSTKASSAEDSLATVGWIPSKYHAEVDSFFYPRGWCLFRKESHYRLCSSLSLRCRIPRRMAIMLSCRAVYCAFLKRISSVEMSSFSREPFELSGQNSFWGANRSRLWP